MRRASAEMNNKKLIVVLGMHRSGTSAITRGLQVLGVGLGNRLMPPVEGNNAKGFFEDIDLNALNIEMLQALGSDWHYLSPIEASNVEELREKGYFLRAVELLRQKVGYDPTFGFKDPRVAKLLPFWKQVFAHCQFDVGYVLAVRHPLSVVKSLARRDCFDSEKSYMLWLGHVLTSLSYTQEQKRVLVDYDRLMHAPERELGRIAECLALQIDPEELQRYKSEFLDERLRHTVYDLNDLLLDDTCPPLVREIYTALLEVAADRLRIDDTTLLTNISFWINEFERLKSNLRLVDRLSGQITSLNQVVSERDGQIANLTQAVSERDAQIASLNQVVAERERQIVAIYRTRSWRLTQPLRTLRRLAGWLRWPMPQRFVHNVFSAIRREIWRHGLIGFARRVPYYLRNYHTYSALLTSRPPAADGALFSASPRVPRDIRLHPELAGVGEPIDVSVSIIIPTLNAGTEFGLLLRKLNMQRGFREIEIVIVDSGSDDGTVELARAAGCTVVEIAPRDFTHSYARNTGADSARGDYLLFMVQDAYPIGDYWVYGMLRYLLDHAADKLAAVSCAEYSRSDSDMMYDSLIYTHYRFLGCLEYDRIGEYRSDDHMSLRAYGQLSDVACLISRETFNRYHYHGDYAEDLDLGIRLIKDGYRVAMLASVKVVHSHNRPPYYYLKRSFVDVIFLVGMFEDFVYPHIESTLGLIAGIASTAAHLSDWLAGFDESGSDRLLHEELSEWIREWRHGFIELRLGKCSHLGDKHLDTYIDSLAERYLQPDKLNKLALHESRRFLDNFLSRLEHFNSFAGPIYGAQDFVLRRELREAVVKTFAATTGSLLGFMYMDLAQGEGAEREMAETIKSELKRGI